MDGHLFMHTVIFNICTMLVPISYLDLYVLEVLWCGGCRTKEGIFSCLTSKAETKKENVPNFSLIQQSTHFAAGKKERGGVLVCPVYLPII